MRSKKMYFVEHVYVSERKVIWVNFSGYGHHLIPSYLNTGSRTCFTFGRRLLISVHSCLVCSHRISPAIIFST